MDIRVIQNHAVIGSSLAFSHRDGREYTGILKGLDEAYIVVQINGRRQKFALTDVVSLFEDDFVPDTTDHATLATAAASVEELPASGNPPDGTAPSPIEEDGVAVHVRPVAPPTQTELTVKPETNIPLASLRQLLEIESWYKDAFNHAELRFSEPSFNYPEKEAESGYHTQTRKQWKSIQDSYLHARDNVHETDPKFARIRPLTLKFEDILKRWPASATFAMQAAYLHLLANTPGEAQSVLERCIAAGTSAPLWLPLASVGIATKNAALTASALQEYFQDASVSVANDAAWWCYVRALIECRAEGEMAAVLEGRADGLTETGLEIFTHTAILLLLARQRTTLAASLLWTKGTVVDMVRGLCDLFRDLSPDPDPAYLRERTRLVALVQPPEPPLATPDQKPSPPVAIDYHAVGSPPAVQATKASVIVSFYPERGFGFVQTAQKENLYFAEAFVEDEELKQALQAYDPSRPISVVHVRKERTHGQQAFDRAERLLLFTSLDAFLNRCRHMVTRRQANIAIGRLNILLRHFPDEPQVLAVLRRAQEQAREDTSSPKQSSVNPTASSALAQARLASVKGNFAEAETILLNLLDQGGQDKATAAIEMAWQLKRQDRVPEAAALLQDWTKKCHPADREAIQQTLSSILEQSRQWAEAAEALHMLVEMTNASRRNVVLRRLARCYLQMNPPNWDQAQLFIDQALASNPNDAEIKKLDLQVAAREFSPDEEADQVGRQNLLTEFFLEKSKFKSISVVNVRRSDYNLDHLENIRKQAESTPPSEAGARSDLFLEAAKLARLLGPEKVDDRKVRYYLFRYYESRATYLLGQDDSKFAEVQSLLIEALRFGSSGIQPGKEDMQSLALRFLNSVLGSDGTIPRGSLLANSKELSQRFRSEISNARKWQKTRIDRFTNQFLEGCIASAECRTHLLNALANQQAQIPRLLGQDAAEGTSSLTVNQVIDLLCFRHRQRCGEAVTKLRALKDPFSSWKIPDTVAALDDLRSVAAFRHDVELCQRVHNILTTFADNYQAGSTEERDLQLTHRTELARRIIDDLEAHPTSIGIEYLRPLLHRFVEFVEQLHAELLRSNEAAVSGSLASENYVPDAEGRVLLLVALTNGPGCLPSYDTRVKVLDADGKELGVSELGEPLGGGSSREVEVPFRLDVAVHELTLQLLVSFHTRGGEYRQIAPQSCSISLRDESEFVPIRPNPFTPYREAAGIRDPKMLKGRVQLLSDIREAMTARGKFIMLYGQKRSGKSSILNTLATQLREAGHLSIYTTLLSSNLNDRSFLRSTLFALDMEMQQRAHRCGIAPLPWTPDLGALEQSPDPFLIFFESIQKFDALAARDDRWRDVIPVLLIDEFTELYKELVQRPSPSIDPNFMGRWKALVERAFFAIVVVGQDTMPDFRERYSNELAVGQPTRVDYLAEADGRKLVQEPIESFNDAGLCRFTDDAVKRILKLSACSPWFTVILCEQAVEIANATKAFRITPVHIDRVVTRLTTGPDALDWTIFDGLLTAGTGDLDLIKRDDARAVCHAIAQHGRDGWCQEGALHNCRTNVPLEEVLKDLRKRKVIDDKMVDSAPIYRLRVRLFHYWLLKNPTSGFAHVNA